MLLWYFAENNCTSRPISGGERETQIFNARNPFISHTTVSLTVWDNVVPGRKKKKVMQGFIAFPTSFFCLRSKERKTSSRKTELSVPTLEKKKHFVWGLFLFFSCFNIRWTDDARGDKALLGKQPHSPTPSPPSNFNHTSSKYADLRRF